MLLPSNIFFKSFVVTRENNRFEEHKWNDYCSKGNCRMFLLVFEHTVTLPRPLNIVYCVTTALHRVCGTWHVFIHQYRFYRYCAWCPFRNLVHCRNILTFFQLQRFFWFQTLTEKQKQDPELKSNVIVLSDLKDKTKNSYWWNKMISFSS